MKNEVTNFMYYMYNRWCIKEAQFLFGESLGNHIYAKWTEKRECSIDQNLSWYADLDRYCRQKLVDRANELYNNQ